MAHQGLEGVVAKEETTQQKLQEREPILITREVLLDETEYYIREDTHPFGKFFKHGYKK